MHTRPHILSAASILAALVTLVTTVPAFAMSVSPTHIEMASTGRTSRAAIKVTNTSGKPLPIEAVVQRLTIGTDGQQSVVRDDKNFLVFPPQALIAPGATQVLKLQWVGEPLIEKSESYKISINQLPVKLSKQTSAVQILVSFGVIVNVAPPQGSPYLVLVNTGLTSGKKGKRYPVITVKNPSPVHALLPQSTIRLRAGGWSRELPPTTLRRELGMGLVQPGATRRFILPVELPANVNSVQASLDFSSKARR